VRLTLPPNQLGLVFGRSGAGKTTLLQLVAGLAQPSAGFIGFEGPPAPGAAAASFSAQERMASAGLVFQFPERHFIGASLSQELVVGWPLAPDAFAARQALSLRAHEVLAAVGLRGVPLDAQLSQLSDGYKRWAGCCRLVAWMCAALASAGLAGDPQPRFPLPCRPISQLCPPLPLPNIFQFCPSPPPPPIGSRVALAVQLARRPRLLLLDEPLAGLDWRTRGELVALLAALKRECTVLVVSHDLRELAPLVDAAWEMRPGGRLGAADARALPMLQ
jgi:energy-coupling factor transporter ATP-binding protein EcfA2